MSSNFSANQYEGTFGSKRLLNWCPSKDFKERPSAHVGHTSFIVNSRGHLLPGVKKGITWPDFKGTWDLPTRIPANHIDPTARSKDGLRRLKLWGICPPEEGKSQSGRGSRNTDVGKKTSEDVPPPAADPSKEAEVRSESQSRSIAGSQGSQRHEPESAAQQNLQATQKDKPVSATEESQALISRVGSETQEIPESILGTPHRIIRYGATTVMNKE
ncbi:PREDICTED: protein Flattop isoform X1 [Poecilia mexicana]|uniref:Protein Flattop n=1 Tax=Poecilia mexicana TaxID=48701 RepID=A0A3B3XKK3_9TELE|nr:PREDICTED: protein Flattop isoform X1 [Poecilia mexicana]